MRNIPLEQHGILSPPDIPKVSHDVSSTPSIGPYFVPIPYQSAKLGESGNVALRGD
ncbi:MAG: hypothetical protein WAN65_22125 [Candidatus Sulfotelmatobacter sp.]